MPLLSEVFPDSLGVVPAPTGAGAKGVDTAVFVVNTSVFCGVRGLT
jgi:hypothetical protein